MAQFDLRGLSAPTESARRTSRVVWLFFLLLIIGAAAAFTVDAALGNLAFDRVLVIDAFAAVFVVLVLLGYIVQGPRAVSAEVDETSLHVLSLNPTTEP